MSTTEIRKGLAGVVVDTTAVSKVVPETNSLTYRGYAVQDLCATCSFEEVAYLLWYGDLPDRYALGLFTERERAARRADKGLLDLVAQMPLSAHPMDVLRTAVSWLGARDPEEEDSSTQTLREHGLRLMAVLPTVIAFDQRRRRGLEPIPPDHTKSYSENFLAMCFWDEYTMADVRAFDVSMILYAEHSFNASTFTARVVTSTTSDYFSAITAAIGALKGSLHGGANEAVMHHMRDIGEPSRAAEWVHARLDAKQKIMGFGHRVYRDGDSRVPTMEAAFRDVAAAHDGGRWVELYDAMAEAMIARTGIKPNLDFPAGPTYHLLGFDIPFFTPLFVASRVTGWTAHVVEQTESNALIRPLSAYSGVEQREVKAS